MLFKYEATIMEGFIDADADLEENKVIGFTIASDWEGAWKNIVSVYGRNDLLADLGIVDIHITPLNTENNVVEITGQSKEVIDDIVDMNIW